MITKKKTKNKKTIYLRLKLFQNLVMNSLSQYIDISLCFCVFLQSLSEAKEKYRGMFEIQKSGDKTSSGEIGLDIRTYASPKVGQDQVSGEVSVLCWHAASVVYVLWKPCTIR